MRNLVGAGILAGLLLSGCANLNTINRVTNLPNPASASSPGNEQPGGGGKAIHLDAFQRLVIASSDGSTCAEPSPDGLAAYAAALGLSGSVPGTGAASLSASAQQTAAMIGLRTQSITLMRDALFRLCEARAQRQGQLLDVSETMLLERSQDLTAVVVAVEQLTGAVAANQVILGGSSGADSQAQLVSNLQVLETVRKTETERQQALARADTELADHKTKRDTADTAAKASKASYDAALKQTPASANLPELEKRKNEDAALLVKAEADLATATQQQGLAAQALADARKARETVERNQDGALSQAAAHVTGGGSFAPSAPRGGLDPLSVAAVSGAVRDMVQAVLKKDYLLEACTVYLTGTARSPVNPSEEERLSRERSTDLCNGVIANKLAVESREVKMEQLKREQGELFSYGISNENDAANIEKIKTALLNADKQKKIREWVGKVMPSGSIAQLLYDVSMARYRQYVVDEFVNK